MYAEAEEDFKLLPIFVGIVEGDEKMPAPRRPKKVFIQFAVALFVAAALGIGALVIGFSIITSVSSDAEKAKQEAAKKQAQVEKQLAEIKRKEMAAANPMIPISFKVVQATTDLKQGEPITPMSLILVDTPDRPLPGTVTQLSQAIGKMVRSPIIKGETLEMGKLLDSSSLLNVDNGMRAITVQVDNIGGLNGALMPGMRVDVLATVTKEEKSITRTLLQDVQVISTTNGGAVTSSAAAAAMKGQPAPQPSGGGGAITLSVTPKQAELLTLANKMAELHMTLRHYGDKKRSQLSGADLTALMTGIEADGLGKKAPKLPVLKSNFDSGFKNINYSPDGGLPAPNESGPAKKKFSMQIYTGTGAQTVDFEQ